MRAAKQLPEQSNTPAARRKGIHKVAKKSKKWAQLSDSEKDDILKALALQFDLVEE